VAIVAGLAALGAMLGPLADAAARAGVTLLAPHCTADLVRPPVPMFGTGE